MQYIIECMCDQGYIVSHIKYDFSTSFTITSASKIDPICLNKVRLDKLMFEVDTGHSRVMAL